MNKGRHHAREAALQILYLWEIGRTQVHDAIATYFAEHDREAAPEVIAFATRIVEGTAAARSDLDAVIQAHSTNWRLERLATIDRLVLRMAIWELRNVPETPAAVVLDEAVELARRFGAAESPAFVNGVLDAVRKA